MPDNNNYAQDVGRLEGRMDSVDNRIEKLEASIKHLTDLVTELKAGQDKFKGGYAMLGAIAGIAAACGSLVTWVFEHVTLR
jgi:hypothetical protein